MSRLLLAGLVVLTVAIAIAAPRFVPEALLPLIDAPLTPAADRPTDGSLKVMFTDPIDSDRIESRRRTLDGELIEFIDGANSTIDIAVYKLELVQIAHALARARSRGVRVRLVTDSDSLEQRGDDATQAFDILQDAGVPIVGDERSGLMHNKFVIRDGDTVWTGSWNMTKIGTYRNDNNAVVVRSPELAAAFESEFEQMFTERKFGPEKEPIAVANPIHVGDASVEVYFAPADRTIIARLAELIDRSQQHVNFMTFALTHDRIGAALRRAAGRGPEVTGVFERSGSGTDAAEYGLLRQAGLSVYLDGNAHSMHHKVIIVDGQTVVTGSFNISASAERANDENVLVIHDANVAAQYLNEFERVYKTARRR